ncbi:MAG: amidohydrolase [Acidobacteriota bacterium]
MTRLDRCRERTKSGVGLTPWLLIVLALAGCRPAETSQSPPPSQHVDILITGGTVVTMDADLTLYDPGFVAVSGDSISAVGPLSDARAFRADRTIEAKKQIILPGLVNGHQHAPMVLLRGLADDLTLMDWLERYIFPTEAKVVDAEFVYWGALLSALEMVRTGTTTFADMYYFEGEVARAVSQVGMRGVLGETLIGFPSPDFRTPQEALGYTEEFIQKWKDHALIVPAVAPHAAYTCSEEVLLASSRLAERYDVPILIHVAESKDEINQVRQRTGMTSIRFLNKIGFLSDRVVAAHVVWADAEEISILKDLGVGVIHNPESNMKLASGVAPIPEMLEAGLDVGLGTDGAASNNNLDMFQEMDTMAKLFKITRLDPTLISARQALATATMGSARALGLGDQLGSLEAGKKADLIILDQTSPAAIPTYDPYSSVVYSLMGDSVRTSIVGGKIIMEGRRLTHLDTSELFAKVAVLKEKIRNSLQPH